MTDTLEYGPVPDDRVTDYQRFLDYAFTPTQSTSPPDSVDDLPAPARVSDRRGLFNGPDLRAVCGHFWIDLLVRGEYRTTGGLAEVATLPEDRHQGLVSRLVRESLDEYRERDLMFSALWPFEYPFYRKYGWATVSRHARTTIDPAALSSATTAGSDDDLATTDDRNEFVRLSADRWADLASIYETHNRRPLSMRRSETWWRDRVLTNWGDDPHVYGVERVGELVGYLIYSFESTDEGTRLDVDELGYVDGGAFRDLLRFCFYHDAQVAEVRIHGPIEEALTLGDHLAKPDRASIEVRPGPMLRIVDVPSVLETLATPIYADASEFTDVVVLEVHDPVIDENDGRFALRGSEDGLECTKTDETPAAELDIGTLAQLVVGHRSATEAADAGDIVGDADRLDPFFPPVSAQPYLREWF